MTKKLFIALIFIILLTPTAAAQEPSPAFTQGRLTGPLPLTATGKISKLTLREQLSD